MTNRDRPLLSTVLGRIGRIDFAEAARANIVPLFFLVFGILGAFATGKSFWFLANEIITRMARNSVLVLSLLIPVTAGLGLNFGIVLGAMAGQTALITVTHYEIMGMRGLVLAAAMATPLAIALGWFAGVILNRARGREMIAGMILAFFMNGIYQLVYLFGIGTILPMRNKVLMLPQGIGLRNTIDLKSVKYALDSLFTIKPAGLIIPVCTLAVGVVVCLGLAWLTRTKLGQDLRAVGQDMHVAEVSGINVNRTRIIAVIISTTLAAWGQLAFLQNIGTLNTYNSHEQVGMFAIAALLVGGATVAKATIGNAFLGTFLFHLLFIVSPYAGQRLIGSPQIGEYFRVFVAYGIIGVALAMHAWRRRQELKAKAARAA